MEKKNYKELADKIFEILNDDKKRKAMGNYGRIRFKEKFTLETFEKQIITILDN